ncbi:MAG: hypothetical protein QOF48_2423 [Verrucomicrobiota bacterium]
MKIDDMQKAQISGWIAEGAKLSDIQKRIGTEFGLTMTYMEVRLLVDDLKLVPNDPIRPKEEKLPVLNTPAAPAAPAAASEAPLSADAPPAAASNVAVSVDAMARPGTLSSGTVTFSDGQTGGWYLDEQGRLGVAPNQKGYKPAPADVEAFQRKLEVELARIGY